MTSLSNYEATVLDTAPDLTTFLDYITLKLSPALPGDAGCLTTFLDYITLKREGVKKHYRSGLTTFLDYITLKRFAPPKIW